MAVLVLERDFALIMLSPKINVVLLLNNNQFSPHLCPRAFQTTLSSWLLRNKKFRGKIRQDEIMRQGRKTGKALCFWIMGMSFLHSSLAVLYSSAMTVALMDVLSLFADNFGMSGQLEYNLEDSAVCDE